jgi:hypothetical protein
MDLGPHAAPVQPDHRGRALDGDLPLATDPAGQDDLEAVQVQQQRPGRTTLLTHLGPPSCWTSDIRKLCEAPDAVWEPYGARQQHLTTLHDEESS